MKKKNILESMEYVDAGLIAEAESYGAENFGEENCRVKNYGAKEFNVENYKGKGRMVCWVKYGTVAACLCLLAAGAFALSHNGRGSVPNGTVDGGKALGGHGSVSNGVVSGGGTFDKCGLFPEGIDAATYSYSVAVYPETEDVRNVETADVTSVSEEELQNIPLAAYLPATLPDGFHFGRGSIYETVMKDGTRYNMLRIEYITGMIPEQQYSEDGGAIVPDAGVIGEHFLVMVTDFAPRKVSVYAPDEMTVQILEDGSVPYIRYGEKYIGVDLETADAAAVLNALASIH